MSRCFPFPPPGYEPKACTRIFDLSAKEKQQREKKHKKEKGDKDKRKHREKRDKDQSNDKRKGKKDQSHRERKKENDRVKGWTTEDIKADGRTQGHKENWQKTDEIKIKDSKFEEELGKRTRDDGAENPMVGNFTNSVQRKLEGVDAAISSLEKERVADSRVYSVQVVSVQSRNDRSDLPIENVSISLERRAECISNAIAMEKERRKMHEKVFVGRGTEQSRNHGISWSTQSIYGLVNRKSDGSTAWMKDQYGERNSASNSVVLGLERGKLSAKTLASSSHAAAQRRKDVLGMSVENLSILGITEVVGTPSLYSRIEGMDTVPPIKKEKSNGGEMFQRQIGQAVEKDIHQKLERKNKTQRKKTDDRKGQNDSAHIVKKIKASDKDGLTKEKKKEENTVENAEDIEQTRFRNSGKKDQVNTFYSKPLTPHTDNSIGITPHTDNAIGIECFDRTMRNGKILNINDYLQENNERPVKIPRMILSSVNGRSSESHTVPSNVFLKSGAINKLRSDRLIEHKERKINGNAVSQQSPIELKPPASGDFSKNPDVSFVLLPHPDSKYLSQIYTVPKMVELPDIDDQEWLFDNNDSLLESKIEAEKIPQVFAEAMRIDLADILALPYVVPF